ncbi:quercetin 2,3-dioxygenase [Allomuricauda sp. d1]|uniref:quercetin 2,3-dioxygenase n=1 Tax=Allomuricauda sp. d1 TaxID=3136725 RepID=UPI0031CDFCF8
MNRKTFLKASAFSVSALATVPVFATVKKESESSSKSLDPKIVRAAEGKRVNVIGDQQTFKLTGKDTDGQFTLIEEVNPPGTMIPLHVHTQEDEIFKVLEGELEVTVGDKTTVLKAGDLAFAPKNVPHSWKVVSDTDCKTILSAFPAGIEIMFEELGELPAGKPDFAKVAEICGRYGITFIQ